jgi:uncharacterized protein (TIGR02217 family)
MSNAVYPFTLPGLSITVSKGAELSTLIQEAVSGRELRISQRVYPKWKHSLQYNFMRDTAAFPELKTLGGFYLSQGGPADSFLFPDPDDSAVVAQLIGTGNGSNRDFQLVRAFGAFVEPVFYPNVITDVYVNAVSVPYTLNALGSVNITTAPAGGTSVTWTGSYYFRSRFDDDSFDFEKFLYQVWKSGKVKLVGSLQDKVA